MVSTLLKHISEWLEEATSFKNVPEIQVTFVHFQGCSCCLVVTYYWWKKSGQPVEVGSFSHSLQGFIHPRSVVWDFWTINSTYYVLKLTSTLKMDLPKRKFIWTIHWFQGPRDSWWNFPLVGTQSCKFIFFSRLPLMLHASNLRHFCTVSNWLKPDKLRIPFFGSMCHVLVIFYLLPCILENIESSEPGTGRFRWG